MTLQAFIGAAPLATLTAGALQLKQKRDSTSSCVDQDFTCSTLRVSMRKPYTYISLKGLQHFLILLPGRPTILL